MAYDGEGRERRKSSAVSIYNWLWTLILSMIPIVNLVFFIVCACVSKKASKRNWALANIILIVAVIVLTLLTVALFGQRIADAIGAIKVEDLISLLPQ